MDLVECKDGEDWGLSVGSLVSLFLLYIAWRDKDIFVLVSAFLGALPDVLWVLTVSPEFDAIHNFLHSTVQTAPPYSLMFELLGNNPDRSGPETLNFCCG
jgi:hypothetical protein